MDCQHLFEMADIYATTSIRTQLYGLISSQTRACGIGAMRTIGNKNQIPIPLMPALVIRFDNHEAGDLTMGTSGRLESRTLHTGDFGEIPFQLKQQAQRSLSHALVFKGMYARKPWQRGNIFIEFGIVLHRTGSERIKARIHAKVALGKMGEMANNFDLAYLRQWRGLGTKIVGRNQ